MTTLFGISNCDTVKKARRWLDEQNISYYFHDFRKDGLDQQLAQNWLDTLGAETLVNKRSTTWKQLNDAEKSKALSNNAAEILLTHPTLIKRPVLETKRNNLLVGFKPELYQSIFS